jgi:hypothetical protein
MDQQDGFVNHHSSVEAKIALFRSRTWPLLGLNVAQYFLSCAACHHF